MSLTLITPPAEEPLTLSDLKSHLKIDGAAEDALLSGLIVAARQMIEARFQIAVVAQTWRLSLDRAGTAPVVLPISPVISIDAVGVSRGGFIEALPAAAFEAQTGEVGRVRLKHADAFVQTGGQIGGDALGRIVITFTAGWVDANATPEALKQAIRVLASHLYENRESAAPPADIAAFVAPYRQVRL